MESNQLVARLLVGQRSHHAGASAGAGIGRGMRDSLIDLLVADDSLDHPALVQVEIKAPLRVEVVVFQIQTLDPSILPVQSLFRMKYSNSHFLATQSTRSTKHPGSCSKASDDKAPLVQHPVALFVPAAQVALGQVEIHALYLCRRGVAAVL